MRVLMSDDLKRQVAEVGAALCVYLPGHGNPEKWPSSRCDCKYGASGIGEQNGCAEMRSVYRMLSGERSHFPFFGEAA
jgi:hypothetical protein